MSYFCARITLPCLTRCAVAGLLIAACSFCTAFTYSRGALAARLSHDTPDATRLSAATLEGRLAIFDDVWQTIRERYYDPRLIGLDWEAIGAEFRTAAAGARSEAEFYAIMRRMVGRLRDAHTRIYAPGQRPDWQHLRFITAGVRVREIDGRVIVTKIEPGSEAKHSGVRPGDKLVSLDGRAAATLLAQRMEEQSGSSTPQAMRIQAVSNLFDGLPGSFATAVFTDEREHEKVVRLRREFETHEAHFEARHTGNYGIIHFNEFTPETAARFARALDGELRTARGLVLDLRDNGGGEAEAMTDIASIFLPPGTSLGRFTDREERVALAPQTRRALISAADEPGVFRGPLVILTSARTASAAEIFVAALKEAGRAVVFGEETCGCVLGVRHHHTLPDGGTLDLSELDYRTALGIRLEGVGVRPDQLILPSRHDLEVKRDRAMERALKFLKTSSKK